MTKVLLNALIDLKKQRLTHEERRDLLLELRKTITFRELSKKSGIPSTTLFHWITPRSLEKQRGCEYWKDGKCEKDLNKCNDY